MTKLIYLIFLIITGIGWIILNELRISLQGDSERIAQSLKKARQVQAKQWIDTLTITEETSKPSKLDGQGTIFYIREKPFKLGFSYQSTTLTLESANWVISQLKRDYDLE